MTFRTPKETQNLIFNKTIRSSTLLSLYPISLQLFFIISLFLFTPCSFFQNYTIYSVLTPLIFYPLPSRVFLYSSSILFTYSGLFATNTILSAKCIHYGTSPCTYFSKEINTDYSKYGLKAKSSIFKLSTHHNFYSYAHHFTYALNHIHLHV